MQPQFDPQNIKVIKLPIHSSAGDTAIGRELFNQLREKFDWKSIPEDLSGIKFKISFKNGCRRKLKNIRFAFLVRKTFCNCCGPEVRVSR